MRLTAGAALALLAGVLGAPASARGECGHDVTWAGMHAGDLGGFEHLARAGVIPEPGPEAPARPVPCHGPSCSRNSMPPSSPPVVDRFQVEPWGCLAPWLTVAPPGPVARAPEDDDEIPSHAGLGVFHPPRPSRSSLA